MSRYYQKGAVTKAIKKKKIVGAILLVLGILTFLYFLFPIISYQLFLGDFIHASLEVPIPKYMVMKNSSDFGSLISQGISSLTTNYTDARNWYPNLASNTNKKVHVPSYSLSIPELGIQDATVSTQDYDLDQHLVQYLGTAIPGQNGTAVIFGHSTIPAWFDPHNYRAIFATLHTIKVGDEIEATVSSITYRYKIFAIDITNPDDVNILSQSYDHSYITIVTCTPPGTTWRRLIVRASLEAPETSALSQFYARR